MAFRNPIVAGNTLVRNAIQSPNFLAGSAGWIIRRDGTAEFNSAVFRGTVVIESGQAVLIYSGATPAAGNLVISIAGAAGVDAVGNSYPEGFAVNPDTAPSVRLGLLGGTALQYWPSGVTNEANAAAAQALATGVGTAGWSQLVLKSAQMTSITDYVALTLASNSDDATHAATLNLNYVDGGGGVHHRLASDAGGIYAPGSLTIGAGAALGDNGVGELQLANAGTVPSTNPAGGCVLYAHQGVPTVRDSGGQKLGMVRAYSAQATGNLSSFTAETAVPGATVNVTVTGSAATVLVTAVWDMQSATSTATMTGLLRWNGVDQAAKAIFVGATVLDRYTVAQTYEITGVSAGTYTAALYATCSASGAANSVNATHTGFTALVIDQ